MEAERRDGAAGSDSQFLTLVFNLCLLHELYEGSQCVPFRPDCESFCTHSRESGKGRRTAIFSL
jgi:hypothetical protein